MSGQWSKTIRWVIRGTMVALFLAGVIAVNGNILQIRLQELDLLLGEAAYQKGASISELLGRYQLILERLENGEDSLEAFETEVQLAALSRRVAAGPKPNITSTTEIDRSSIEYRTLTLLRRAIGKPTPVPEVNKVDEDALKDAFFLERNRDWSAAIVAYQRILEGGRLDSNTLSTIRLHLGFCHSMNGDYDRAIAVYRKVLEEEIGTDYGSAAARLIDSVDKIASVAESQRQAPREPLFNQAITNAATVTESPNDPLVERIEAGQRAFLEVRFEEAIATMDTVIAEADSIATESAARYYKARSLEEQGEYEAAVHEYRTITAQIGEEDEGWSDELLLRTQRRLAVIETFYLTSALNEMAPDPGISPREVEVDDPYIATIQRYAGTGDSPAIRVGTDAPPLEEEIAHEAGEPSELPEEPSQTPPEPAPSPRGVARTSPIPSQNQEKAPETPRASPRQAVTTQTEPAPPAGQATVARLTPPTVERHERHERASQIRSDPPTPPTQESATSSQDVPKTTEAVASSSVPSSSTIPPAPSASPEASEVPASPASQRAREEDSTPRQETARLREPSAPAQNTVASSQGVPETTEAADHNAPPAAPPAADSTSASAANHAAPSEEPRPRRLFLGNVIQDEHDGALVVLMETDTKLSENQHLAVYRNTESEERVLIGTAIPVGRIPPKLIARIDQRVDEERARVGDWVYVIER